MRWSFVFLLLLLASQWSQAAQLEFRMLTLQYRFAQDVLPVIEPMVLPDGKVSAFDNHLMITASPQQLQAIEQVIAKLDQARRNIKITISHDNQQGLRQRNIGIDGEIRIGDRDGEYARQSPHLDLRDSNQSNRQQGSQFLNVLDGEQAFIRVGQSVPYTRQWAYFTQRYLSIVQTTEFRDIATGFAIRPRMINHQVELEIMPRIARLNAAGYMDFEELRTVVRVEPGEWFDLGGAMQNRDEVSREILRFSTREQSQNNSLKILVE